MTNEKLTEHKGLQQGQTAPHKKNRVLIVLAALGPGVVAAMAGNDAGGISTYSTIGAKFGYGTLWIIPIMMVMLAIVQEGASRMGAVTGKGFASLIREQFGVRLTALAMIAVLIESGAATLSEFAGIAAGMELFGVSKYIAVPIAGVVVWLLVMGGSYKRVEKVFLAISCVFVTYIVAAFLAQPNWGEVGLSLVIPHFENNPSFISLVIATVGTTIAPWMIFLTQNNVVDKGVTPDELPLERIDAIGGAIVALPASSSSLRAPCCTHRESMWTAPPQPRRRSRLLPDNMPRFSLVSALSRQAFSPPASCRWLPRAPSARRLAGSAAWTVAGTMLLHSVASTLP